MKPPHSLPLQMAERLLRAQPDSIANHVTDRSISDSRDWLLRLAELEVNVPPFAVVIKLISGYVISYDVNRRYGI